MKMEEEMLQLLKENNLILKDCQSMIKEIVVFVRERTSPEYIQRDNDDDLLRNINANIIAKKLERMFNL